MVREVMTMIVRFDDFILYQEKYKSTYLDKKNGYAIHSPAKQKLFNNFQPINEIFEGTETDYSVKSNDNGYLMLFESNSGTNYRIDLIKDKDIDSLYHIGFSLANRETDSYDNPTYLNESKEVLSKIIYILKDVDNSIGSPEYCIGVTGNHKKDNIYQYMMRFIKGWEKRNTDAYALGWGLFFKLNYKL